MEKNKEITLSQGNALTESRYDFNRLEKNALYCIIRQVRHDYIENDVTGERAYTNMRVQIHENVLSEIADKTHREDAKAALINLRKRDVTMESEDGSWFNCGFINWSKYDAKRKCYEVEVSSEIMPYLVDLASRYTTYSLTVALSLKSKWSQRFYELCCQYRNHLEHNVPVFHKSLDQLRKIFMLEGQYKQLADFKSFVIDRAQKELKTKFDANQCDVWFDYNQNGRGSKATFDFRIYTREETKAQQETAKQMSQQALYIYKSLLRILKRDPKFCEKCYNHLTMNPGKIPLLFEKMTNWQKKYKDADLARVVRFALEDDFDMSKATL